MRARVAASVLVLALTAGITAGCTFLVPQASQNRYDPSDGVSGTVGQVQVINAIVISDDGTDGNLVFSGYNPTSSPVTLNVQYTSAGASTTFPLTLAANQATPFGTNGQVLLSGINTKPGALLPVYFQYASEPGLQLQVPVLNTDQAHYATLTPTPLPTPVPLPTITPLPGATPEPTATN